MNAPRIRCVLAAIAIVTGPTRLWAQLGVGASQEGPRQSVSMNEGEDPAKKAERLQKQADQFFKRAQEHRAKGRIAQAISSFKSAFAAAAQPGVGGQPVDGGIADAAINELKSIFDEGKAKLEEAIKAYESGKYVAALDIAGQVRLFYPGVLYGIPGMGGVPNLATLAAELERKIEADPAAAPALQQARAESLVKRLARFDKDAKRDPAKRLDIFSTLKTLAEKYPSSDAGRNAARRLAEMQADASLMEWIKSQTELRRLRSDLAAAEQYVKGGKPVAAQKIYDDLRKRYPGKSVDELKDMVGRDGRS